MRTRHIGRVIVAALASIMVATAPLRPNEAYAHHDGTELWGSNFAHICDKTPLSQCVANDANHFYALIDLSTSRQGATQRALSNLYAPNSEINVFTSNSSDLKVFETLSGVDAFAWTQCATTGAVFGGDDPNHTGWCQPQYFFWQTHPNAAAKVNTTAKYNYIGCHEVGHSVGLRHRSATTCMQAASKPPSDPNAVVPSVQNPLASDYARINDHYPIP
jgi:hypothetical protein